MNNRSIFGHLEQLREIDVRDRHIADLRAENAKLREALLQIVECLEREGNSARKLNQDQNDKWSKWLKSRRGRQPYTTPGMDYAAEVMLSASKKARAALASARPAQGRRNTTKG